jgi:hypothetical protein
MKMSEKIKLDMSLHLDIWEQEKALLHRLQSSEQACEEYLVQLKWPNGFICPYCGYGKAYIIKTRRQPLYECICCKHQTSITAGTLMEGTRTSLIKWFTAIYCIADPDQNMNATTLSSLIHVTYKTAWSMLHAIRGALSEGMQLLPPSERMCLHSETLTYSHPTSSRYDPPQNPSVIVCISLTDNDEPRLVHMKAVQMDDYQNGQLSAESIEEFCDHYMGPAEQAGLVKLKRFVASKLKKGLPLTRQAGEWLQNTFCGIGSKYRQRYLDEFCCRINLSLQGLSVFQEMSRMCARSVIYF